MILSYRYLHLLTIYLFISSIYSLKRLDYDIEKNDIFEKNNILYNQSYHRNLNTGGKISQMPSDKSEHEMTSLPGLNSNDFLTKHYAGILPANEHGTKGLFYWFFESTKYNKNDDNYNNIPLIIWLNGGPGCSSMDGLFLEVGPFRVKNLNPIELNINPYSWHNEGHLLFIDQPVGTGYSYTRTKKYCTNDKEINIDFYYFLNNFMELYKLYNNNNNNNEIYYNTNQIYFTGESHAGHYIPSMVNFILNKNEVIKNEEKIKLNEKFIYNIGGIAIGNGWTDPYNQYDVSDMAHGHGIITSGQLNTIKIKKNQCQRKLKKGSYFNKECWALMDDITKSTSMGKKKLNVYDVREYISPGGFPPGKSKVEGYLNNNKVKKAIHATDSFRTFEECSDEPWIPLKQNDGLGVTKELTEILNKDINVLYFNGINDLICNHLGNEKFLLELKWKGQNDFINAIPGVWSMNGNPKGIIKKSDKNNLSFLLVRNAGHMVPLNVPQESYDIISRFINNKSFYNSKGNIKITVEDPDIIIDSISTDIPLDNIEPEFLPSDINCPKNLIATKDCSIIIELELNLPLNNKNFDNIKNKLNRNNKNKIIKNLNNDILYTFDYLNNNNFRILKMDYNKIMNNNINIIFQFQYQNNENELIKFTKQFMEHFYESNSNLYNGIYSSYINDNISPRLIGIESWKQHDTIDDYNLNWFELHFNLSIILLIIIFMILFLLFKKFKLKNSKTRKTKFTIEDTLKDPGEIIKFIT